MGGILGRIYKVLFNSSRDISHEVSKTYTDVGIGVSGTRIAKCEYCNTDLLAYIYHAVITAPQGADDHNIYHDVAKGLCPKCGVLKGWVSPIISETSTKIVVRYQKLEHMANTVKYANVKLGYTLQNQIKTKKILWIHNP